MGYTLEEIENEITDYIANNYVPSDHDDGGYAAINFLEILADRIRPKLLENEYEKTGNVLFLWEAIDCWYKQDFIDPAPHLEVWAKYLHNVYTQLTSVEFPPDATRYMLICDELGFTGNPPPFSQYIKAKHIRVFLATYYEQVLLEIFKNGPPKTDSNKNKLKKGCRDKAAKFYKYRNEYDDRSYFNWAKASNFTAPDLLCFIEYRQISLEENKWKVIDTTGEVIDERIIVEILSNPLKYRYIFDEY